MLPDEFIDACMDFLPNLHDVTVSDPSGTTTAELTARRESATEEQKEAAGVGIGTESVVFFIPVGQTGFVRPRGQWTITDDSGDGTRWVVQGDNQQIQDRGMECVCTRAPTRRS